MGNSLAKEFDKLKKKEIVDLKKRGIQELPTQIGNLKCKELYLSENDISSIPIEISKCPNLSILDLSKNRITSLPSQIGELKTLKELILNNNKLFFSPLTPDLGKLNQLIKLDLSFNQLDTIPSELGNLINLEHLNISNNQLKTIPPEIGKKYINTKKKFISLYNRKIRKIISFRCKF